MDANVSASSSTSHGRRYRHAWLYSVHIACLHFCTWDPMRHHTVVDRSSVVTSRSDKQLVTVTFRPSPMAQLGLSCARGFRSRRTCATMVANVWLASMYEDWDVRCGPGHAQGTRRRRQNSAHCQWRLDAKATDGQKGYRRSVLDNSSI